MPKMSKATKPRSVVKKVLKRPGGPRAKKWAEWCGSASTGKPKSHDAKTRNARPCNRKEAPGPKYSGKIGTLCKTQALAHKSRKLRLSYRMLCGCSPCDRIRVGVEYGYLEKKEGMQCPGGCGARLALQECEAPRAVGRSFETANLVLSSPTLCRYRCEDRTCTGKKHGYPVEEVRGSVPLGGRGKAPAGEGLLALNLALQPWAAHHPSVGDCSLLQGVCQASIQLYLDTTRRAMAKLNEEEQKEIIFTRGMWVEWDECGIRTERLACPAKCTECNPCVGYRLLWNRWLIGVQRGNRKMMVVIQLPWKTSDANGGGVPISADECDSCCVPHLGKGVINLTDGATSYEAFAKGDLRCSPDCDRESCLDRARKMGLTACPGSRPRSGRDRFEQHYKHLQLSHGVVSHKREEWSLVKKVAVYSSNGKTKTMTLKHGTECADGAWTEIKAAVPTGVHTRDHARISEYVNAWAWKARRHGQDLFAELGLALSRERQEC